MPLPQELAQIDWPVAHQKIQALVTRDRQTYGKLALISGLASAPLLFVFPLALMVTIPLCLYFWILKNRSRPPYAWLVTIRQKECWHRPKRIIDSRSDSDLVDDSYTLYLLKIDLVDSYTITTKGPDKAPLTKTPTHLRVNTAIYHQLREGGQAFFIFSAADDIIAYFHQGAIIPLVRSTQLSNGQNVEHSASISQDFSYPPGDRFQRMDTPPQ